MKSAIRQPILPLFIIHFSLFIVLASCSVQNKISQSAKKNVLSAPALTTAHVGISIYEPATGKYWFNYQGDKYFVPASNTKIPTCYAAMKYLGDSLAGLRYAIDPGTKEVRLQGTGDPTLLNTEYKNQPVFELIKKLAASSPLLVNTSNWQDKHWGAGWTWSDYDEAYMAERSPFPVFGNIVSFINKQKTITATPSIFESMLVNADATNTDLVYIQRDISLNNFLLKKSGTTFRNATIPFVTNGYSTSIAVLNDTLHSPTGLTAKSLAETGNGNWKICYSQPTDSLLKPMMHRSDNFFAEQSLLMVSNERLGYMSDAKIIDTLLKTDFSDLPQKPRWVDGSGLSRYNLFTPQDMVAILNKMKNEFGMSRIQTIFPTGGTGTISSYYKSDSSYIYAKTGTLSGVVALSGFLTTRNNKQLIFSVLVNNHQASATDVRRAVEKFLQGIRADY